MDTVRSKNSRLPRSDEKFNELEAPELTLQPLGRINLLFESRFVKTSPISIFFPQKKAQSTRAL